MAQNLSRGFCAFHYLRRNRIAPATTASPGQQEIPMLALAGFCARASAAVVPLLAHSLNMPEPLVRDTGVFMSAQVQAVENSSGRDFARSGCGVISVNGSAGRRVDLLQRGGPRYLDVILQGRICPS
jgi:hypothetical protein